MISIHTFELSLELSPKQFNNTLSHGYKLAKEGRHRLGYSKHSSDIRVDDIYAKYGIMIEYHDHDFKKSVNFRVNPSELLGGTDLKLWKPTNKNIGILTEKLNDFIYDYFEDDYTLDDFTLSRVEFTANLNVGTQNVSSYIHLMHKIGTPKGFSPKYTSKDYKKRGISKENSFDLENKRTHIEFSMYDKAADLLGKNKFSKATDASGILRAEVRLKKRKAVLEKLSELCDHDSLTTEEELQVLAVNSSNIFCEFFASIVPCGVHYQFKVAKEKILNSDLSSKKKEKMTKLIDLIPKKKSLYSSFKEFDYRDKEKMLNWFAKIDVSPLILSKRAPHKPLDNIYSCLQECLVK